MADTWGATTLNIMEYERIGADINQREEPLIPDPNATGPQSVEMGAGRLRRQVRISGHATIGEYNSLRNDKEGFTSRTLTINDADSSFSMSARIISLRMQTRKGTNKAFYTATFREV